MKAIILIVLVVYLVTFGCAYQSQYKRMMNQEVVIILSSFIDNYDYDTLMTVRLEMETGTNPNLTTTEEVLTKLIKQAQMIGANAITNLELGSYDIYGHLHMEDFVGQKHVIYGQATAVLIHDLDLEK